MLTKPRDIELVKTQRVRRELCQLQQQMESMIAALQEQALWTDIQRLLDQAHAELVSVTTRFVPRPGSSRTDDWHPIFQVPG
jgi:replicative DNA helicase